MTLKKNEDKRKQIVISFPDHVSLPVGIEGAFHALADMICMQYEKEHAGVLMWPAGIGSRLKSGMSNDQLEFDDSTFVIECSMREMTERDKYNRGLTSTYVPPKRSDADELHKRFIGDRKPLDSDSERGKSAKE